MLRPPGPSPLTGVGVTTEESIAPPRNVFFGTAVFVEANFNYVAWQFLSIGSLAKSRLIQIFLTDLTIREIKANLNKDQFVRSQCPYVLSEGPVRAPRLLF